MAKSNLTIQSQSYSPDTRVVSIPNLSTDDVGITVKLTRESWPVGNGIVSGIIESSDDGLLWQELTRFSWNGGDQTNPRTGLPVTEQWISVGWPERYVDGVPVLQRPAQVRARITNTVTLTTAITLVGR